MYTLILKDCAAIYAAQQSFCAKPNENRPNLEGLLFTIDGEIVATNGRILVVLKDCFEIDGEKEQFKGLVLRFSNVIKNQMFVRINFNENNKLENEFNLALTSVQDINLYPTYQRCIPDIDMQEKDTTSILSINSLSTICDFLKKLGYNGDESGLTFYSKPNDLSIAVTLVPIRHKKHNRYKNMHLIIMGMKA